MTIKCYFMQVTPLLQQLEDISLVKQVNAP